VRDRQYAASLAGFTVSMLLALAGIVALPLWLGWAGAVPLVILCGGFLAYFYWGPRPDLRPSGCGDGRDQERHA
jgi:hypothetical protein